MSLSESVALPQYGDKSRLLSFYIFSAASSESSSTEDRRPLCLRTSVCRLADLEYVKHNSESSRQLCSDTVILEDHLIVQHGTV